MKRHMTCTAITLAVGYGVLSSLAVGQEVAEAETTGGELAAAEQIIDDYLEAIGGRDKLANVESRVMKGKMKIPLHGAEAPIEIWQKQESMAAKVEFPGLGDSLQGVNGEVAWDVNPMMGGARLLKGKEKQQLLKMADLQVDLHFDNYYKSATTVGRINIDDRPHYQVELETVDGNKETRYYDCTTGLLSKVEQKVNTPMGELDMVEEMSDYRSADGIMIPFVVKQVVMGTDMIIEYASVEINAEIDDARFTIPEAVQELMDGAADDKKKEASAAVSE